MYEPLVVGNHLGGLSPPRNSVRRFCAWHELGHKILTQSISVYDLQTSTELLAQQDVFWQDCMGRNI